MDHSPRLHRKLYVTDVLANAMNRGGEEPLLILEGGKSLSVAQVRDATSQYMQALQSLGIARGSRVALLSANRPEVLYCSQATQLCGAMYLALHPLGSLSDHLAVLDEAKVDLLIIDASQFSERAKAIAARHPAMTIRSLVGDTEISDIGTLAASLAPKKLIAPDVADDDIMRLGYSGGTTGTPKSIPTTQRVSMECLRIMMAEWEWPNTPRILSCAPLSHAGAAMTLPALLKGGSLLVLPRFEPVAVLAAIEKHRINCTMMVPTMITALLDCADFDRFDLSSLETVFYGASAIAPARLREALQRIGPVFSQFYGQAECPQTICVMKKTDHKIDDMVRLASCGRPVPWLDVELLDEVGQVVTDGTPGEICVRGPLVMDGYRNNAELTEAVFKDDWLHTGDIAVRDANGFLRIVDRKKDMIVTGGFNVYPREIEDILTAHAAVAAAAVIGLPDDRWGEIVTACVVLANGQTMTQTEVQDLVRSEKGAYQTPKRVIFIDAIPQTAVGKPDKKTLRATLLQNHPDPGTDTSHER